MNVKLFLAVFALAATSLAGGDALAADGDCGFEPDLNHADSAQVPTYLAEAKSPKRPTEDRACAYYALGTLYHFDGDYAQAIVYYDEALGWWDSYADAYEGKGDAYAAMGNGDLAAKSYQQAATAPRDQHRALAGRCRTRAIRGAPLDRALADCTDLLNQYDDDYDTMLWRGLVLYRMGRYDDAIAQCTALLQSRPRNADALYVRGLARNAKGDAADAAADFAAAKDADYRIELYYKLYHIDPPA